MQTDDQLIHDCRRDAAAFRELVERYQRRVFSFLLHMVGRETAEDLFQDVFVRVLENAKDYRGRGKPAGWLLKIAHGVAIDHMRKEGRVIDEPAEEAAQRMSEPSPGPLAVLEREETRKRIAAAIKKLPEDQRKVFLMREYGELSFQEISDALDLPLGTTLSRMNYAVRKLRAALGEAGDA